MEANKLQDQEIPLCKDCRYYADRSCYAPENMAENYEVGGKRTRNSVIFLREEDRLCGPEGAWFEPKAAA